MPLRQVQADSLSRGDLRPLRRGSHAEQGPARAHGPHRALGAGGAYLVLQDAALADGQPAGHHAQGTGAGRLLLELHRARGREAGGRGKAAARRRRVPGAAHQGARRGRHDVPRRNRRAGGARAAQAHRYQVAGGGASRLGGRRDITAPQEADAQATQDRRRVPLFRRQWRDGE